MHSSKPLPIIADTPPPSSQMSRCRELIKITGASQLGVYPGRARLVKKRCQRCNELRVNKRLLKQHAVWNALSCPVLSAVPSDINHWHVRLQFPSAASQIPTVRFSRHPYVGYDGAKARRVFLQGTYSFIGIRESKVFKAGFRHDLFEIDFYEGLVFSDKHEQAIAACADDLLRLGGRVFGHEAPLHWQAGALSPQPPAPTSSFASDEKNIAPRFDLSIPTPSQSVVGNDLDQVGRDTRILLTQINWLEEVTA